MYLICFSIIKFVLDHITNLPKYSVVSDNNNNKAQYFPRKKLPTIKSFKPIYYVLERKEAEKQVRSIRARGHIEFTHSFKVRGHYRRINPTSFGKDRNGEYKLKGITFVKDYVKGEGELVKKLRVGR